MSTAWWTSRQSSAETHLLRNHLLRVRACMCIRAFRHILVSSVTVLFLCAFEHSSTHRLVMCPPQRQIPTALSCSLYELLFWHSGTTAAACVDNMHVICYAWGSAHTLHSGCSHASLATREQACICPKQHALSVMLRFSCKPQVRMLQLWALDRLDGALKTKIAVWSDNLACDHLRKVQPGKVPSIAGHRVEGSWFKVMGEQQW